MTATLFKFPSPEEGHHRSSTEKPTGSVRTTITGLEKRREPIVKTWIGTLAVRIEIDKLYPAEETARHELVSALQLLADAIQALDIARQKISSNDVIGADRYVGKFQVLLPQLFQCRGIGDGFGGLINALEISFVNQHGMPLSEKQLLTVWRAVKELRAHPFLTVDEAADRVDELENTGLRVDPVTLGEIFDQGDEK